MVAQGWGTMGRMGAVTAHGHRVASGGDKNVLKVDCGDGYATL